MQLQRLQQILLWVGCFFLFFLSFLPWMKNKLDHSEQGWKKLKKFRLRLLPILPEHFSEPPTPTPPLHVESPIYNGKSCNRHVLVMLNYVYQSVQNLNMMALTSEREFKCKHSSLYCTFNAPLSLPENLCSVIRLPGPSTLLSTAKNCPFIRSKSDTQCNPCFFHILTCDCWQSSKCCHKSQDNVDTQIASYGEDHSIAICLYWVLNNTTQ